MLVDFHFPSNPYKKKKKKKGKVTIKKMQLNIWYKTKH